VGRYIIKRIISAVITILFIMTLTFLLMRAIPGDPFTAPRNLQPEVKAALYAKYGLDQPLYEQYLTYLKNYAQGDFGVSYHKIGVTTNKIIADGFPYSLKIGGWSSLIIIIVGIGLGIIAALKQNKVPDRLSMIISTLGATVPSFVFATLYLYVFSKKIGWAPSYGAGTWKHFVGPVLCIGMFSLAYITRLTRTSLLDVLQQDYIRTARAKGLSEGRVIFKHALRNALIPVVTYVGPMIASLVTGSFVVEKVFGIAGIGSLFTTSITNRDYTLIMGITVFFGVFIVIATLLVDIIYVFIDPRIKYD
jgi:oligopeptide transport system permease protein